MLDAPERVRRVYQWRRVSAWNVDAAFGFPMDLLVERGAC